MRRTVSVIAALMALIVVAGLAAQQPPAAREDQNLKTFPPFRIVGNLYYVGMYEHASYLITTPEGNILINTGVPGTGKTIRANIESLGFRVRAYSSAIDFLASSDIGATSCMIADVHMPKMSGIDLFRRLGELGHAIPTILITAYPNEGVRDRVLADGAVAYLTKPFDDDHLIGCVQSALQSAKPGDDA